MDNLANPVNEDDRKESIDSQEFLLGENMTDSSSDQEREQLENSCSGNCQQYSNDGQQFSTDCQQYNADGTASCSGGQGERNQNNDFYDPLMNHNIYCNDGKLFGIKNIYSSNNFLIFREPKLIFINELEPN